MVFMFCSCALTFLVMLSFNNVAVDAVYGNPLRCVQGKFHYNEKDDALVFRRETRQGEEWVTIRLPHPNIRGFFSVFYCWGQESAIVGNEEVNVEFKSNEKEIA